MQSSPLFFLRAPMRGAVIALLILVAGIAATRLAAIDYAFKQTNLVSDIPGYAKHTDPNLVNPWGIAASATSPFWISNNGSNTSTLYNTTGTPQALVVNVPGGPTGQVFNGGAAFNADRFIFSGEDGVIRGWRGALGNTSEVLFDNSSAGALYKGLAISNILNVSYLYAANFGNGHIDVFSSSGDTSAIVGSFLDPSIPAGYVPYNIQHFGSLLYVTYAYKANPGDEDETIGPGLGYVSVFDILGGYISSLGAGGPLNAPWGLAIAPSSFGNFGGDLLVGNFGDGTINVYDVNDGSWLGVLKGMDGDPLSNPGLWGLIFGNGGNGGLTDTLYFTAGIPGDGELESHGLFGSIQAVAIPEPSTVFAGGILGLGCLGLWIRRQRKASVASK